MRSGILLSLLPRPLPLPQPLPLPLPPPEPCTHTRTQTEPRCVTFCRLGRDRAACVYLPLTLLPLPLPLPVPLPLPLPLPHTLPFFLASDPSTCDRLGCIYLLLDNNSSFAGMRWLLSLPLMSGPMPLCVCMHWCACVCAACVGLISA